MDEGRRLAVVVCTRNRPDAVAALLPQVLAQLPDRGEVWVIDQSDPDAWRRTAAGVAQLCDDRAHHLQAPSLGLPRARRLALGQTRAAIVLFLDDDVTLTPGCLSAHVRCYRDPTIGGVVGRIVERVHRPNAPPGTNRLGVDGRIHVHLESGRPGPVGSLKGANMSVRRAAISPSGGFDPQLLGTHFLEDTELSLQLGAAGWTLWFAPDAQVHHHAAPAGGVRHDAAQTLRWRLENTAYVVARHRGIAGTALAAPSLAAVALGNSLRSGGGGGRAAIALGRAWVRGVRRAWSGGEVR